ncbi:MAG: hypothetical protein QM500_07545 [Methylococcales bacterium]
MHIYQLGGDFKKLTQSYKLKEPESGRLHEGVVDHFGISSLGKLVGGEITSSSDLEACENTIRSLIFHENTTVHQPSMKIHIYGETGNPFTMSKGPELLNQDSLQQLYESKFIRHSLGNIHQLIAFHHEATAIKHIAERELKAKITQSKHDRIGAMPTINLTFDEAPLEYIAGSYDEFFNQIFPNDNKLIANFVDPLLKSGNALYFGDPTLSNSLNSKATQNADQFFDVINEQWGNHLELLKGRIEIPIPLLLSVVLTRARNRTHIPEVIIELREEFKGARTQLWSMFDEAEHRLLDTNKSVELLNSIKNDTNLALDKVTKKSYQSCSTLNLDIVGRILSLLKVGGVLLAPTPIKAMMLPSVMEDIYNYIDRLKFNQSFRVDAAHLLSNQLMTVELKGLLEKHLTENELNAIA